MSGLKPRPPKMQKSDFLQGAPQIRTLHVDRLRRAEVSSRLRFGLPDRRVPYYVVKMALFRLRTDLLKNCHFHPDERYLVSDPRRRVRFRIGESHVKLQGIKVHALVSFHEVHLVAVRITKMIEPGSVVITIGLNDECVSLPPSYLA